MKLDTTLRALSFVVALPTLASTGCLSADEGTALDDGLARTHEPQGIHLQGVQLQGVRMNGINFNGVNFNGIAMNGVHLDGAVLEGVAGSQALELRGGEIVAFPGGGGMLGGEDLEGAMLAGALSNGGTLPIEIADVSATADPEIYEYTLIYWDGTAWGSLCGESDGAPVRALALEGTWDSSAGTPTGGDHVDEPGLFTFACKDAVIAKCVGMGYAPWRAVTECYDGECHVVSMRDMHQACTRMMRADYCGDGTPHTQDGTLVNVWDDFEIQAPDVVMPVAWHDEAEWSPNGALCIEQVRWSGTAEGYVDQHCSERWTSTSFECFEDDSTFFPKTGFATPIGGRSLIRNQFTHDPAP
jgi:hypothetical protein